ncbi:MAG: hypothetical protein ACO3X4_05565 [Pelagibacteraceae bacterium]|jgi:hypothetical protein
MTVFELVGLTAWIDWASRGTPERLGLFTSREKAEAKIAEIKSRSDWRMEWSDFDINEVEVI